MHVWVQVHDLPYRFMQEKVDKGIGAFVGELKEYDPKNTTHSSQQVYMTEGPNRCQLTIEKEMNVRTLGETWITAKFRYERLGTFYFLCGVLGHRDKTCAKLFEVEEDDGFREWSNDLKPESCKRGVNTVNSWL